MATDTIEKQDITKTADKEAIEAGDRLRADSQPTVAPGTSTKDSPFAPANRPDNYSDVHPSQIEMSNPFEDNDKEKHDKILEQLPILAIKAATEGRRGITIMSLGYPERTGRGMDLKPEAQRVFDEIAAQGFRPVIEEKQDPNDARNVTINSYYDLKELVLIARWDDQHHPELHKLTLDTRAAAQEAFHERERNDVREKIANLPALAVQAATEGGNRVYITSIDKPDQLDVHQQEFVEAIKAKGFIPEIVNESPRSNYPSWRLQATWDKGPGQQCSQADATATAIALDESNISSASEKFQNCGYNGAGILVDQPRFQQFAQEVAAIEKDGTGLDLELHYTIGTGKAFVLNDLEIR